MTTPDKPCPFCGSAAERDRGFGGYVRCTSKTGCPLAYDGIAADHWNRRALASPAGEGGPKYSWGADGTVLADFTDDPGYWTAPEQPGSSVQGEVALSWLDNVLERMKGQLQSSGAAFDWKIVRDYHADLCRVRNSLTTPPPAPAAERCHDCHEPTAGRHICLGCAELRAESVADAVRSTQPEARGVDGMVLGWVHPNEATYDRIHRLYGKDGDPLIQRIPAGGIPVLATPNPVRAEQPEGKGEWKLAILSKLREALGTDGTVYRAVEAMLAAAPAAPAE